MRKIIPERPHPGIGASRRAIFAVAVTPSSSVSSSPQLLCYAMRCESMLGCAMLRYAMRCYAMIGCAVLCCARL
eukprot:749758-Pyramimonas_sp.AAC.1